MFILIFSIFSIVNGFDIELDIPLKFDPPKWMNNDSLTSFFTKTNESQPHSSTCVIFNQESISAGTITYTSTCIKDSCKLPTVVPPAFCPLSGSVTRIDFHMDNITQAISIVVKGCYLQDGDKKIDGDWYLSNKNTMEFKGFNDSVDISSLNTMKCSELCNSYDCYSSFKYVFRLAFHTEEGDIKNYKNLLITTVGGGVLFLVVVIIIFVFVKNINKSSII